MTLNSLPIDSKLIKAAKISLYHRDAGLMPSRSEILEGVDSVNSRQKPEVFGVKYWERWVRSYPDIAQRFHGAIVRDGNIARD